MIFVLQKIIYFCTLLWYRLGIFLYLDEILKHCKDWTLLNNNRIKCGWTDNDFLYYLIKLTFIYVYNIDSCLLLESPWLYYIIFFEINESVTYLEICRKKMLYSPNSYATYLLQLLCHYLCYCLSFISWKCYCADVVLIICWHKNGFMLSGETDNSMVEFFCINRKTI